MAGRGKETLKNLRLHIHGCQLPSRHTCQVRGKDSSCLDWAVAGQEAQRTNLIASPGNWMAWRLFLSCCPLSHDKHTRFMRSSEEMLGTLAHF